MTTVSAPVCEHIFGWECWLCSDADPRWADWRIRAGLPAEPPYQAARFAAELAFASAKCAMEDLERRKSEGRFRGWATRRYAS